MHPDFSKVKKVFIIGIGGIGISALAKLFIARGAEVSGVNDEEGKTVDSLRDAGIKVHMLPDLPAKALAEEGADMYIYSDAWIYRGPEIIEKARATGVPVLSYFEALGEIAKDYKVIAISGTHGKTTTTAMVAEVMIDAGLDPTVVVGSFIKKFGSNFRAGKGEPARPDGRSGGYLVVEADEYNRHFLNFHPYISVITNIEADHLDVYKDLDDIKNAFGEFIKQTKHAVVYAESDTNTHVLVHEYEKEAESVKMVDYSKFVNEVPKLSVPGDHNRMNAAAALAVAEVLGIDEKVAQKSLTEFSGTWRRLEKRGVTDQGTIVYDDYAHHPTEIRASIQALRELYPKDKKNLVILFQPHLYSRTKALFKQFSKSFLGADRLYILPIYYAREDKDESISSGILAEAVDLNGVTAYAFPDFASAEEVIRALGLGENDVFVTMGAGEAYKVADSLWKL
jgi:UDP-N-acetylmuramate--alanine ligase